jgi:hypothetical protein
MTYKEAVQIIKDNEHLIGQIYRGSKIDDLIIEPINPEDFQRFKSHYIRSLDAEGAIQPFKNSEVFIAAVFNRKEILKTKFFLQTDIENLRDEKFDVRT